MHKIFCQQGTEDWLNARRGAITGSQFKLCRDRYKTNSGKNKKGDYKDAAKSYAFGLAIERISGERLKEGRYTTWEMKYGTETEPEARVEHEEKIGQIITEVGFAVTECHRFGASLDGEIGEKGMAEYKCLTSAASLHKVIYNLDPSEYIDQVQGGMWVCDKEWAHLCIYCKNLRFCNKQLTILEAERDDEYIEGLVYDLMQFDNLVEYYKAFLLEERGSEIIKL
jgi:hypothetical protein